MILGDFPRYLPNSNDGKPKYLVQGSEDCEKIDFKRQWNTRVDTKTLDNFELTLKYFKQRRMYFRIHRWFLRRITYRSTKVVHWNYVSNKRKSECQKMQEKLKITEEADYQYVFKPKKNSLVNA